MWPSASTNAILEGYYLDVQRGRHAVGIVI